MGYGVSGRRGLFVGLVTLDLVYLANDPPIRNQKIVAQDYTVAAGGPATNAAVAFQHLGNEAMLAGGVGVHPMTQLILADLQKWGVTIMDLDPTRSESPPVSSIIVTQTTGERAVVSLNAAKTQIPVDQVPTDLLSGVDIVLIDGHQMQVGAEIARQAKQQEIPVVIDGGSWKPGFETVLPSVDYAVCSANFYPPNCQNTQDVLAYLAKFGISQIAITHGGAAIEVLSHGQSFQIEVPQVKVVDTLGAGDIFHGAFCHFILQNEFTIALSEAAKVAALACQSFGTRQWIMAEHE